MRQLIRQLYTHHQLVGILLKLKAFYMLRKIIEKTYMPSKNWHLMLLQNALIFSRKAHIQVAGCKGITKSTTAES